MIDFRQVWLPQILGYAQLIADENVLRRAWLNGEAAETSVTAPDEMIEQVFGDLAAEEMIKEASFHLASAPRLAEALREFLHGMAEWDIEIGDLQPEEELFHKPKWKLLRNKAAQVLNEAQPLA